MKKTLVVLLFFLLLYTRLVGLNWGLLYALHPDERNMDNAIQGLNCEIRNPIPPWWDEIRNCFNPHFFAYGQFPLYLGYFLIQLYHLLVGRLGGEINFIEAVMSLRIIAATASVINVFILMKIIQLLAISILNQNIWRYTLHVTSYTIFIFLPYFIQFSHFGTTESLLMLFYSLVVYFTLQLFNKLKWRTIFLLALVVGLAIATKISSLIFLVVPLFTIILNLESKFLKQNRLDVMRYAFVFVLLTGIFALLFSPHNLISWQDFFNALRYESATALGSLKVFYTRQFEDTIPIWFQLTKIFPYALGWPTYLLSVLGFVFLSWRKKEINFLRFAFLIYFIPNAFLYTKWTRFMAPIFPIMSIFAVLFILSILRYTLYVTRFAIFILIFASIIPGFAYLSIYQNPDVRFTASDWIYKNIPANSYILSETANVIDLPIMSPKSKAKSQKPYKVIPFNFYDLDGDVKLQAELKNHLAKADYIFVPSRRIFMNLRKDDLMLNSYYQKLFSGELGVTKVAEFSSYPKISLLRKTLFEFPDEQAEETWTVFDHPVIRIYRKVM